MKGTHQRARALLDSIGSTIDTHTIVGDLSASEMQMVEITKALSFDSKLIIMDEPSSSLTAEELKNSAASSRICAAAASPLSISATSWTRSLITATS